MSTTSGLRLRPLRMTDEPAVLAAQTSMAADGFEFALGPTAGLPWPDYLEVLGRQAIGDVSGDLVPATLLLATVDGR